MYKYEYSIDFGETWISFDHFYEIEKHLSQLRENKMTSFKIYVYPPINKISVIQVDTYIVKKGLFKKKEIIDYQFEGFVGCEEKTEELYSHKVVDNFDEACSIFKELIEHPQNVDFSMWRDDCYLLEEEDLEKGVREH